MITITIEQIHYFFAIEKFKGFSTAANELCISQSSLSKQIKSLETELDTVLFDRTSRSLELTEAGKDFYIYAEKFLQCYTNIINGMKKHSISKKPTLTIGTIAVITQYGLTSAIAAFKNKYPNIDINIVEDENEAILNMLIKSEIDIAIMRDFNLPKDLFNITHIAEDELVVVTSTTHPFCKKKYISFSDLQNQDIIMSSRSGVYDICLTECEKLGFLPNVIHNINKIETILGLVSEGLGITLIVNDVLKPFKNYNIKVHHLKKPINYNLALVTNINAPIHPEFEWLKNFIIENI